MARLVELNLRPDQKTLRQFGFIALFGFGLMALLAFNEAAMFRFGLGSGRLAVTCVLSGLGLLAAVFSLLYPAGNLPIYVGLSVLFFPIGFVLSYVLLGVLFFCIVGPVALLVRVFATDPMQRRYRSSASTYWIDLDARRESQRYFRQF
jgi:hypothetical protein